MNGTLDEQIFKLINIYNYSKKFNKEIVFDDNNINICIKKILEKYNNIKIINHEEFNKIPFLYYIENYYNKNNIIPFIEGNLYIRGFFIEHINYDDDIINFIKNLLINENEYYNEAINIINNIKNISKENDFITIYYKKPNIYDINEPDIKYYNSAYELLNSNNKFILILSDDIEWCKRLLSKNKKFYFIENKNECVQLIIMILSKILICGKSYLSYLGAYLDNTKEYVIFPNILNINKNNNNNKSIYIDI